MIRKIIFFYLCLSLIVAAVTARKTMSLTVCRYKSGRCQYSIPGRSNQWKSVKVSSQNCNSGVKTLDGLFDIEPSTDGYLVKSPCSGDNFDLVRRFTIGGIVQQDRFGRRCTYYHGPICEQSTQPTTPT